MIPVSTRHLKWLVAALLVAIAPIYASAVRTHDECGDGARAVRLMGVGGIERVERYKASIFQWASQEVGPGGLGHAVIRARALRDVAKVRSFVKPHVIIPTRSEVRVESHDGVSLPIRFSHAEVASRSDFVAHLFVYQGRPVESVLPHQLSSAWEQLVSGRRPVTLLMAWGTGTPEGSRKLEAQATRWIVEAWKSFRSQCES